jgi:hypothetical protein
LETTPLNFDAGNAAKSTRDSHQTISPRRFFAGRVPPSVAEGFGLRFSAVGIVRSAAGLMAMV